MCVYFAMSAHPRDFAQAALTPFLSSFHLENRAEPLYGLEPEDMSMFIAYV
jgi:hypothetical protein